MNKQGIALYDVQELRTMSMTLSVLFLLVLFPSMAGGAEFVFHDEDHDLLADLPIDKSQWVDPEVLTFSIIQETDQKR